MDSNSPADGKPLNTQPNPSFDGESLIAPSESTLSLSGWFRQNGLQLVIVIALVTVVCRFLHPLDVLLAGFGMSLIIFIHELGHFAAAKLCDVHVKTFSIGFGPALPFCSFKYGETTYKLAMIPLGGFVAMIGEGEGENGEIGTEENEDDDTNPRSFKNKTVLQRMFIISAGVVMNIFLASICFIATYMHGVEEMPGIISQIEPGSAAWRAGIHSGTEVKRINGRENPWFDDIRPIVSSTHKGETVALELDYQGNRTSLDVEPIRGEGALYPQLGVLQLEKLTLPSSKREEIQPYIPGSVYADAKGPEGSAGFKPGDTVIGMTDPDNPSQLKPITPNFEGMPGEFFDYARRLVKLAGKPITFQVTRKEDSSKTPVSIVVLPSYRYDLGVRMRMGAVATIRRNSPAEKADVQIRDTNGEKVNVAGDQIVAVEVPEPNGTTTRFTTDSTEAQPADAKTKVVALDPMRLPYELDWWSDRQTQNRTVKVTVLREVDHALQRKTLEMVWDASYRYEFSSAMKPGTPIAINGLGLAYHVQTVVNVVEPFTAADRLKPVADRREQSPAAKAGILANDKILEIKFKAVDHQGTDVAQKWSEVRPHQWAFVDMNLQYTAPHTLEVKLERDGQQLTAEMVATPDTTWPVPSIGLALSNETRTQKADGVLQALEMGGYRTLRAIKMTYQGLYAMAFGRISPLLMSGPITLARASYLIAGQDIWHLLLWMALISINLAVVNFMPIPVLDGGHMMFLGYEAIRGKPAPVSVQVVLTYIGLAMVLCLMLFVIGLDLWRLLF